MKHLEQGGQVSEESQGMAGARDMFASFGKIKRGYIMAIEQVQNLPQQYVTDLGVDYGKQLAGLTSIPLDTAKLAPHSSWSRSFTNTELSEFSSDQVLEHINLILQQQAASLTGPTSLSTVLCHHTNKM